MHLLSDFLKLLHHPWLCFPSLLFFIFSKSFSLGSVSGIGSLGLWVPLPLLPWIPHAFVGCGIILVLPLPFPDHSGDGCQGSGRTSP